MAKLDAVGLGIALDAFEESGVFENNEQVAELRRLVAEEAQREHLRSLPYLGVDFRLMIERLGEASNTFGGMGYSGLREAIGHAIDLLGPVTDHLDLGGWPPPPLHALVPDRKADPHREWRLVRFEHPRDRRPFVTPCPECGERRPTGDRSGQFQFKRAGVVRMALMQFRMSGVIGNVALYIGSCDNCHARFLG